MDAATQTENSTFGTLARALNPRAIATRSSLIEVAYDGSSLAASDLVALRELGSLHTEAATTIFRAPAAAAAELERVGPVGAVLASAQRNALQAPAPAQLMGIVNVTPDSFSDGGRYATPQAAIGHGLQLAAEGASMLDIGGESTRPGATPVAAAEELRRVLPVLEGLAGSGARLSIDTTKAEVARRAIAAGASIVNDISAGEADADMLAMVAEHDVTYVCMHRRGKPESMQEDPRYDDVLAQVCGYLRQRAAACLAAGIAPERLMLDPGIGFGKRLDHNLALIRRLGELRSLGRPLLLGVSRKSFISHITGTEDPADFRGLERSDQPNQRIGGSAAAALACASAGAAVLRVHEVRITREALEVFRAIASDGLLDSRT